MQFFLRFSFVGFLLFMAPLHVVCQGLHPSVDLAVPAWVNDPPADLTFTQAAAYHLHVELRTEFRAFLQQIYETPSLYERILRYFCLLSEVFVDAMPLQMRDVRRVCMEDLFQLHKFFAFDRGCARALLLSRNKKCKESLIQDLLSDVMRNWESCKDDIDLNELASILAKATSVIPVNINEKYCDFLQNFALCVENTAIEPEAKKNTLIAISQILYNIASSTRNHSILHAIYEPLVRIYSQLVNLCDSDEEKNMFVERRNHFAELQRISELPR